MKHVRTARLLIAALVAAFVLAPSAPAAEKKSAAKGDYLIYVGTYTGPKSQGIYAYRFRPSSGEITSLGLAGEAPNPSFVAIHPNRRFLYAVSEINSFEGQRTGAVSAFSIDHKTGKLTSLNRVASKGAGPAHLTVDHTGKDVLVANYGSGSVAVLPIRDDGSLAEASSFIQHTGSGANPKRQQGPHAHSINVSPDNRFAIVADLGLDEVLVYRFDAAKGTLTPNDPPFTKVNPGAGPRHFAFHPNGHFAYVIDEMELTVTAFSYDASKGVLTTLQTISTMPKAFTSENNSTAEVQVHPSGKSLYGSNRGHNSIAVFTIDPKKGTLTHIDNTSTEGKTPRNFGIDPTGAYLFAANQQSDTIVVFRIDPKTGKLTPTGQKLEVGSPVCVKFVATD